MSKVVHKVKHWIDFEVECKAKGEVTGTKKDELVTCKRCKAKMKNPSPKKESK